MNESGGAIEPASPWPGLSSPFNVHTAVSPTRGAARERRGDRPGEPMARNIIPV